MANCDNLNEHPALRQRKGKSGGVVELTGYLASCDDTILELWTTLDGDLRIEIPRDMIVDSHQADAGVTRLTVPQDANLKVTQVGTDRVEAQMIEGLITDILDPREIALGASIMDYQKGAAAPAGRKPKWCKTLPVWKCIASGIVIATSTICTETWPCEASSATPKRKLALPEPGPASGTTPTE